MSAVLLERPRALTRRDDRSGFHSGYTELDDWFQRYAWQNQKANNASTVVTTCGDDILGYYALATSAYAREQAPDSLAKGRPTEIPCILLARLAVDLRAQGRGVGAALLRDAIERSYRVSELVAAAALVVHCQDERAKQFYLHNGDFLQAPGEGLHLLLPMVSIHRLIHG